LGEPIRSKDAFGADGKKKRRKDIRKSNMEDDDNIPLNSEERK